MINSTNKNGFIAVEAVVGLSLSVVILVMIINVVSLFMQSGSIIVRQTKALHLAEGGLELVRFVRDENWATIGSLEKDKLHYLSVTPPTVNVNTTPEVIDDYIRSFEVLDVYRDINDDIIPEGTAGGTLDASTILVRVHISFDNSTTTLQTYLTDLHLE